MSAVRDPQTGPGARVQRPALQAPSSTRAHGVDEIEDSARRAAPSRNEASGEPATKASHSQDASCRAGVSKMSAKDLQVVLGS